MKRGKACTYLMSGEKHQSKECTQSFQTKQINDFHPIANKKQTLHIYKLLFTRHHNLFTNMLAIIICRNIRYTCGDNIEHARSHQTIVMQSHLITLDDVGINPHLIGLDRCALFHQGLAVFFTLSILRQNLLCSNLLMTSFGMSDSPSFPCDHLLYLIFMVWSLFVDTTFQCGPCQGIPFPLHLH